MAERLVPATRTIVTMPEHVRAVLRAWNGVDPRPCTKEACALLWAQYRLETGGSACFNYNIGNVKHVPGDGFDYHELRGVWEGVSPDSARHLIATGQAVYDDNPGHAHQVGSARVSVIFQPPHPATWFRAFPDLATAMTEHLHFLVKRYGSAWRAVYDGDVHQFAILLRARGYFTAEASAYSAGMVHPFNEAMSSTAFEDAVNEINVPIEDERLDESTPIVHVDPGTYLRPEDDPDPEAA